MSASLDEIIAAAGYAKVIVTLNVEKSIAATALSAAVSAGAVESELQNYFIVPSPLQAQSLAAAAVHVAGKRVAKTRPTPPRIRVYERLALALGYVDGSGAKALRQHPRVRRVDGAPELSLIRPVETRPAKAVSGTTWGISRLQADKLWAAGFTGEGVIVGHLDTGVDDTRPELRDAIAYFAETDLQGNLIPRARARDSDTHGTHTAGTIVGRQGSRGSFGVAPAARLASAMVIEGGQVIDRILAGMEWLLDGKNVRILSMSLGLRGYTPAFETVITALRAAAVLPVIAVGNEYPNTSRSPGNYTNVLSVGAMDRSDHVADFSSSQRFNRADNPLVPDLVAPGVGVLSCIPGGYAEMDGTSMATPHIAGLAALLFQAKPDATIDAVETAILESCNRPASMPQERANNGVPDAVLAYERLTGSAFPGATAAIRGQGRLRRAPRPRGTPIPKRRPPRLVAASRKKGANKKRKAKKSF